MSKFYKYDGERCSNCHAGILEDNQGNKQCTNNYTNCDYSKNKPMPIDENLEITINKDIGKLTIDINEAVRKYGDLTQDYSYGKDIVLYRSMKTLEGFDLLVQIKLDFNLKKMED